jgi:outer membrane protein assembly factor BamA
MGLRVPSGRAVLGIVIASVALTSLAFGQDRRDPTEGPVLRQLTVTGATIFSKEDVMWLLRLREGAPLPGSPERVAELLKDRYERDGFIKAVIDARYDAAGGHLTLAVDEGRIDAVEFRGIEPERRERLARAFPVAPGDIYNARSIRRAVSRLGRLAQGALRIGDIELVEQSGKRVLVVPVEERQGDGSIHFSNDERVELFNPVDGFSPSLSFQFVRYDQARFNHTFVSGTAGYSFAREDAALALGFEQPLLGTRRVFVGADAHDFTVSDDDWRITTGEQTLVSFLFRNTFKDYYRRRGVQVFGAARPHGDHEIIAAFRWDRHDSLANESDFSVFRDDHPYRPNPAIAGGQLNAVILAYTYDTRGLLDDEPRQSYRQHLLDDLFRGSRRQAPGFRADWTSELAGRGLGGDYAFDRHILNARVYMPLSPRQSLSARLIAGTSGGILPVERLFAIGGVGSVHGYAFKEAVGERMTLTNLEYGLDVTEDWRNGNDFGSLKLLLFLDAGRVHDPVGASTTDWLRGTGIGLQTGPLRVEFGFRLDDIPDSRQILVRLAPTF